MKNHLSHTTKEKAKVNTETASLSLNIKGMHCTACVQKIEKALNALDNVDSVAVNFANQTAIIHPATQHTVSLLQQNAIHIIEKLGYSATLATDEDDVESTIRLKEKEESEALSSAKMKTLIAGTWALFLVSITMLPGSIDYIPNLTQPSGQLFWLGVAIISFFVMAYSGRTYFKGALLSLSILTATMDTLIAISTGAAFLYSVFLTLFPGLFPTEILHTYYEAAVVIIAFINLGTFLELKAHTHTHQSLRKLINLHPKIARKINPITKAEEDVKVSSIQVNDLIRIRPGEKIAVDGVIVEGSSVVDTSMITGESQLVEKTVNDTVLSGCVNKMGSFVVQATQVGQHTVLSQIIQIVKLAQNSKPAIARLGDKIASYFVPSVLVIAFLSAVTWYLLGPEPKLSYSLISLMTVLIIACPCAVGLAAPISIIVGIGRAAEIGILIKNADSLQNAQYITTLVLDKTGTLTEGKPKVRKLYAIEPSSETQVLSIAASLESLSEHALAAAILGKAQELNLSMQSLEDFQAIAGLGLKATSMSDRQIILLGNLKLMQDNKVTQSLQMAQKIAEQFSTEGLTAVYVAKDQTVIGVIGIGDKIKEEAKDFILQLKKLNIDVVMITGDQINTAKAIANQLQIEHYYAQILPHEKSTLVEGLKQQGKMVGMVGDGINDAPALAVANIGYAMGTGTDIAIESADITLLNGNLNLIIKSIDISRLTMQNIKQNLWGAFIYNIIGIPIAAGILYPMTGILLNPMLGGFFMAMSSVTVVMNANRLRYKINKIL